MLRLRFERPEQVFCPEGAQIVLLLAEDTEYVPGAMIEIPSMIWPGEEGRIAERLKAFKDQGLTDVVAENIGAIDIASGLGLNVHGGSTLNITNSSAADLYADMGLRSITASFELSFSLIRELKSRVPVGIIGYGFLPVMKFRACPARGEKGCGGCTGNVFLTDRTGEDFRLLCRDRRYSELFNCVPLYTGDRSGPDSAFETLYFTCESKEECMRIYDLYTKKEALPGRRTTGLYFRELL